LRASELPILEIDVVHDLADAPQRWIQEPEPLDDDLEGAAVAVVCELGVEHVEADLTRLQAVALRRDELEGDVRVQEAPDQPRGGDPIDVDPLAGHPGPPTELGRVGVYGRGAPRRPRRETAEQAFERAATWRAEEVARDHLAEPAAQAGTIGGQGGSV